MNNPNHHTPTPQVEAYTGDRLELAKKNCEISLTNTLDNKGIIADELWLYFRAFKEEGELEIWAKNESADVFELLHTYAICEKSGKIGPKRKQGDYQVPEGFYHIDRFNPKSRFHLSLGLNYPNASDRILGVQGNLGGDIFIHGDCLTIGCLPMTNAKMEEIYLLALWARDAGQATIPVTVFPCRMTEENWARLQTEYDENEEWLGLWEDLKDGYGLFEKSGKLPHVSFLDDGRHTVSQGR